jgi:hypothetical protein
MRRRWTPTTQNRKVESKSGHAPGGERARAAAEDLVGAARLQVRAAICLAAFVALKGEGAGVALRLERHTQTAAAPGSARGSWLEASWRARRLARR